jgi:hypothetical protein
LSQRIFWLSFAELQQLAREAESAGIEAIFSPEFMNDALANSDDAQATSKITVGPGSPISICGIRPMRADGGGHR